jgi:polyisoprenoid-binding protein YceI
MAPSTRTSALLLALTGLAGPARAADWKVGKGSEVAFTARITGGSFVARSQKVEGTVAVADDGKKLTSASVAVDAASFDTGVDMRNEHMRDKYLEASRFPEIRFAAGDQAIDLKPGATFRLGGNLTAKGVSRPLQAEGRVESASAGEIVASARFKVDITAFGIPRPSFLVVRMDPIVDVTVRLVLVRTP